MPLELRQEKKVLEPEKQISLNEEHLQERVEEKDEDNRLF